LTNPTRPADNRGHPLVNQPVSDPRAVQVERRPKLPLAARLVFGVALIFTLVGVLESGFVIVDLLTGGQLSALRAPDLGPGVRSWTEHHAMKPGYDIAPTHTNSFGLRSPEVAVPKPAGTLRVLLLGDSFTLGFRVGDDEVFARVLERQLRTDYGFSSVEVVNAGVLSYCPLLEYLQYRNHLNILEPDLVVLNFDMSDVQDHMIYARDTKFSSTGVPLYVTEPSLRRSASVMPDLLSFQWIGRHLASATQRVESTVGGVPFARDVDRYLWTLDGGPPLDKEVADALAPIGNLSTLLQHKQIPLVLATYPQPWQVSADATPLPPIRDQYGIGQHTVHLNDRPFRALERFATEHDLPFVNATTAFRQASEPASLFLGNDFHFSVRGHQLYATILAKFLTEHSLIRPDSAASSSPR
jgi:lysophospholipase L1-like esterase